MIRGAITQDYEGIVRLTVLGRGSQREQIEAIVDTGFDGWLSLPQSLINELELPWQKLGQAVLADGSECLFDIYQATVLWDRRRLGIPIDSSETTPLVGMRLLKGFRLTMDVLKDGHVSIERLSS